MTLKRRTKMRRGGSLRPGIEDLLARTKKLLEKMITLVGAKKAAENAKRITDAKSISVKMAKTGTPKTMFGRMFSKSKNGITPNQVISTAYNPILNTALTTPNAALTTPNAALTTPNAALTIPNVAPNPTPNAAPKREMSGDNIRNMTMMRRGGSHSKRKYTRKLH